MTKLKVGEYYKYKNKYKRNNVEYVKVLEIWGEWVFLEGSRILESCCGKNYHCPFPGFTERCREINNAYFCSLIDDSDKKFVPVSQLEGLIHVGE